MTRLPPGWPASWTETDGGGAAELQTDVMRFVAILALCLVAIFALVQSIPPQTPAAPGSPAAASRTAAEPHTPVQSPAANPIVPPAPAVRAPVPAPPPVAKRPESPAPPESESMTATAGAEAGFTLRFESDEALKTLVAQSDVGLYAMHGEQAKRLHVGQGRLEFWTASRPAAFHEMDAATVPGEVISALSRTETARTAARWGVTLPPRLSQEIDRHLATGGHGDLVISATGALRLE